ncbi:hypothetical protein [Streptomyces sp. NPDC058622]|uniref:hypothetical protein n=1 Tax=Streptomyces sp. NPDC058622 TaxID=3346562 RepID=UPI00366129DA
MRTRETAAAGYQRALEAHQQVHRQRQPDSAIAAAVERQNRVPRRRGARSARNLDEGEARITPRVGGEHLVGGSEPGLVWDHPCVGGDYPEDYDSRLDIDFTRLGDERVPAA